MVTPSVRSLAELFSAGFPFGGTAELRTGIRTSLVASGSGSLGTDPSVAGFLAPGRAAPGFSGSGSAAVAGCLLAGSSAAGPPVTTTTSAADSADNFRAGASAGFSVTGPGFSVTGVADARPNQSTLLRPVSGIGGTDGMRETGVVRGSGGADGWAAGGSEPAAWEEPVGV